MLITKDNKTLKLHIDTTSYLSKPSSIDTAKIKIRLSNPSSIKDVTIQELFNCIAIGNTFCPAVLKGGTKNENWLQQELIAIDIDNEDDTQILTPQEAIALLKQHNINPLGYYHSFSSSASKPKFRLLFLLQEPIYEADKMKFILETLIEFIPQADKSCKDLSRLFYGTNKDIKILDPEARITIEDINKIALPRKQTSTKYKVDKDLDKLINKYNLLDYMINDGNEVSHYTSDITYFKNCKICGHKDCLRYYYKTNSFYCFGSSGSCGGNIINYLMITKKMSSKEAIDYFKYNILKIKAPLQDNNTSLLDIVKSQVKSIGLSDINITNLHWIQQYKTDNKISYKVLCSILAKYIKDNVSYMFVKSGTKSGVAKYFYIDNYYKLVSNEEVKGIIKSFIPFQIQRIKDVNEVYALLETNLDFKQLDEINANQFIINFANGILDISTGILKQHSPDYLCTIRIPCNYVKDVSSPSTKYFDNFINDLTNDNEEVRDLLLQIIGVVISNVPRL